MVCAHMEGQAQLLHEIEAFLAESGMTRTTFGERAVNDGHLLRRFQSGSVTFRTAERIRKFIAAERERAKAPRPRRQETAA